MLMWSYYADGHAGIALRLNMSLDHLARLPAQFLVAEVKYHRDLPVINYYGDDIEKIHALISAKAIAWAHEREWRLVLVDRKEHVRVRPLMIDGVLLGLRTNREHEDAIREWISQRNTNTELLRVRNRPGSFDLEVVPA